MAFSTSFALYVGRSLEEPCHLQLYASWAAPKSLSSVLRVQAITALEQWVEIEWWRKPFCCSIKAINQGLHVLNQYYCVACWMQGRVQGYKLVPKGQVM